MEKDAVRLRASPSQLKRLQLAPNALVYVLGVFEMRGTQWVAAQEHHQSTDPARDAPFGFLPMACCEEVASAEPVVKELHESARGFTAWWCPSSHQSLRQVQGVAHAGVLEWCVMDLPAPEIEWITVRCLLDFFSL